jgi:hypothetical protein
MSITAIRVEHEIGMCRQILVKFCNIKFLEDLISVVTRRQTSDMSNLIGACPATHFGYYGPWFDSASNRNEDHESSWG